MIYTDQLGNKVAIHRRPSRIVSVVPSITELLFDLGLGDKVVGCTKFCVHPNKPYLLKNMIGGTKDLNLDKILQLNPDLILANKEENIKEQIEYLNTSAPVWISDVKTFDDSLKMIAQIGSITASSFQAKEIIDQLNLILKPKAPTKTVVYLIWKDPYMTVGGDTYINDILNRCGYINVFADQNRYPIVSLQEIEAIDPDVVLLSSEPYPFKEEHLQTIQRTLKNTKIELVDGEFFSWYGSRKLHIAL
ncbi:helical backbone metal receptor [Maribacter ulvicola]|uniref:ABC-type Fe3+-hydroxamate transport system, substrate-binding protein n=1 Tax=Maribacter ulvicola TaxID=228959 RepID=A0A1N6VH51_9FLAO|nr:helical backbone metal receptor [Maribacter ulvicola]SIQ77220.1 ABC-type Fe3+-hydroxamate transport system, substrate-binding protein [Maribacter ulvicola]